jgi:hypothetical protein
MKKIIFALLLVAAFGIVGQTTAQAATLCTGTLSALEISGCSNGIFTLSFVPTSGSNRGVADSAINVLVTSSGPTNLQVTYTPASGILSESAAGFANYNFEYNVTDPGYGLIGMEIDAINPFVSASGNLVNGFKKVIQTGDEADTPSLMNPANNYTTLTGIKNGLGQLGTPLTIEDNINLLEAPGTTASVGDATHVGSVVNTLSLVFVPEPLTTFLCGFGLLGIGLLRRKFKA